MPSTVVLCLGSMMTATIFAKQSTQNSMTVIGPLQVRRWWQQFWSSSCTHQHKFTHLYVCNQGLSAKRMLAATGLLKTGILAMTAGVGSIPRAE